MPDPLSPLFPVARLLRPQGRRGELLAEPLTDLPDIFQPGDGFFAGKTPESAGPVRLEHAWRPQGKNAARIVLALAGTDSISAAESIQGQTLFILESSVPPPEDDAYMVRDLIGCEVYDGVTLVGIVYELQFPVAPDGHTRLPDAADLLVVVPSAQSAEAAEPMLIPFVKAWLESVDLPARRLRMHLPPGLLDPTEDSGETTPRS